MRYFYAVRHTWSSSSNAFATGACLTPSVRAGSRGGAASLGHGAWCSADACGPVKRQPVLSASPGSYWCRRDAAKPMPRGCSQLESNGEIMASDVFHHAWRDGRQALEHLNPACPPLRFLKGKDRKHLQPSAAMTAISQMSTFRFPPAFIPYSGPPAPKLKKKTIQREEALSRRQPTPSEHWTDIDGIFSSIRETTAIDASAEDPFPASGNEISVDALRANLSGDNGK